MNYTTNLIQYKNWTLQQKKDADFKNYKWERQTRQLKWISNTGGLIDPNSVYRLVIENYKWYYCYSYASSIIKGKDLVVNCKNGYNTIRPARPEELLKQVPEGKELVGYWCYVSNYKLKRVKQVKQANIVALITEFSSSVYLDTNGDDWLYAYPVDLNKLKEKGKLWEGEE